MRAITLVLGLLIFVIQATAIGQISGASVELPERAHELSPENHFSFEVLGEGRASDAQCV
jgi:hypothetical protein